MLPTTSNFTRRSCPRACRSARPANALPLGRERQPTNSAASNAVVSRLGSPPFTLRHQWADGTTHLRFDPVALLGRLAVLIPRPRINLVLYHGVLAPRARWRAAVVASAGSEWSDAPAGVCPDDSDADSDGSEESGSRRTGAYLWADLMRRTFGIDVLDCPRCGGRLRLLALIEHARAVERILRHLGLPTDRPEPRPVRAPPLQADDPESQLLAAPDATF